MKKVLHFLVFGTLLILSSCKDTWDEDDKKMLQKACLGEARSWAKSDEQANTYCNCVLEKIVAKYPHENDALDHLDSVVKDPGVLTCRDLISK